MLRLTLKNLAANRVRFAMTTFAVVLAVSFVVSSFILTDGLRSTFGDLSAEIYEGTDLEVRPAAEFGQTVVLDAALVDALTDVDGVAAAAALVEADENAILPVKSDGTLISVNGPPQLAFGWVATPGLTPFHLVEGEAASPGTFTMDIDAAERHDFVVGRTYDVVTPTGRIPFELSGLTSFGSDNGTVGATLMQFDTEELQRVTGQTGFDAIDIALADGADLGATKLAIETILPTATEVVDNATLESEQAAEFNDDIDIIGNVLLGFAGVSLFVSVFIIYNTFSIVLGQRTRELALLRVVGADPVQLRRSVRGEALVVGVLASTVGIGAGIGVAYGLRSIFGAMGASLPDSPLIISGRTIVVAAIVGIGVTLVSAIGPARRAARVPAIVALRDGADAAERHGARRIGGTVALLLGAMGIAVGLFAGTGTAATVGLLALGAMAVFVGVTLLSPAVVGPVTRTLGWPASRPMGVAGRLAQQNAGRNPRRTATTAAALMIGLALVTMALVVGESVKAQLRSTLAGSVHADHLITEIGEEGPGLPAAIGDTIAASPLIDASTSFSYEDVRIGDAIHGAVASDHAAVAELFDLDIVAGVASDPSAEHALLLRDEEAEALGIVVGDTLPAQWANGETRDLTVVGLFGDDVIVDDDYIVDQATWTEVGAETADEWVAFRVADGVDEAQLQTLLGPLTVAYPQAQIDTFGEYVDRIEGFIDQALAALNVMVALAVIIALIGIANTLALSVFERTRELGLLRAVGMTRRQLRRMVRFEAGLVALFGAVLGVSLGLVFGWAAVTALPATVTSTLAIPYGRIAALVAVAGVAGLIAAWGPARRAGRLQVLDAIAA